MASNFTQPDGALELVPGGSNWVYGDRFFDREAEIEAAAGARRKTAPIRC